MRGAQTPEAWLVYATPLLLALLFVELSDIVFAVDSVPAIFAITKEPLIVFTSNVFAVLGLRSLYFMLAGAVHSFPMPKYGLALVLVFVGLKMAWLNELSGGKFPVGISLAIIGSIVGLSILFSLLFPRKPVPGPSVVPDPKAAHQGDTHPSHGKNVTASEE